MAKSRLVNTRFWNDTFISQLDPIEKLLFIYFITNSHTNICGIYELPLKIAAIETGIDGSMFEKIFPRLSSKIAYVDGWVYVKNFAKHQNTDSPKVKIGIENELKAIPKDILDKLIPYGYPMDTQSHLNFNTNSNLNFNTNSIEQSSKDIVEVIDSFKEVNPSYRKFFSNTTQRAAISRMLSVHGKDVLLQVIKYLPQSNIMPYVPSITTPLQLEDKWASLQAAWNKKKNTTKGKIII